MMKRPHTVWYDEGRLARKIGRNTKDCPYKEGTYGYAEWMRGYTEEISQYVD